MLRLNVQGITVTLILFETVTSLRRVNVEKVLTMRATRFLTGKGPIMT